MERRRWEDISQLFHQARWLMEEKKELWHKREDDLVTQTAELRKDFEREAEKKEELTRSCDFWAMR